MNAKELRELSVEEIRTHIFEETERLRHLRFQHAIAEIQNPIQLRTARRLVARLKTVLRQKEEDAADAEAKRRDL